jgi:hypothetical protein
MDGIIFSLHRLREDKQKLLLERLLLLSIGEKV